MRFLDRRGFFIATVVMAALLVGCNSVMLSPTGSDSGAKSGGQIKVRVTDAPIPLDQVDHVWVTITRVDVLRCPERAAADPNDPNNGDPNAVDPNDSGDPNGFADPNEPNQVADPNDPNDPNSAQGDDDDGGHHGDDADDDDGAEDGQHGERPWITVFDDPNGVEFDLMDLRNGRLADLVDAELPAGSYKQVRVFVRDGRVVLTDGREFPLRVPSGDRSGIKLRLRFEIVEGEDTEVLLDFDLSRVLKPNPGGAFEHGGKLRGFIFRPSLGLRAADLGESGSLGGEASDDHGQRMAGVQVAAYRGQKRVATTYTEDDGSYAFVGLQPGNYTIEFAGDDASGAREVHARVQRGKHTNNADSHSGLRMSGSDG